MSLDKKLTFLDKLDKEITKINISYAWASANKEFYNRFRYKPMNIGNIEFPFHSGFTGIVYNNGIMHISW